MEYTDGDMISDEITPILTETGVEDAIQSTRFILVPVDTILNFLRCITEEIYSQIDSLYARCYDLLVLALVRRRHFGRRAIELLHSISEDLFHEDNLLSLLCRIYQQGIT
jgi:hypothetical protein